jgi:hypothetical protein
MNANSPVVMAAAALARAIIDAREQRLAAEEKYRVADAAASAAAKAAAEVERRMNDLRAIETVRKYPA